jgi:hypothetical protein
MSAIDSRCMDIQYVSWHSRVSWQKRISWVISCLCHEITIFFRRDEFFNRQRMHLVLPILSRSMEHQNINLRLWVNSCLHWESNPNHPSRRPLPYRTGYGLDDRSSTAGRDKIFSSISERPGRLCDPPYLLFNGHRQLFHRDKEAGAWSWIFSSI